MAHALDRHLALVGFMGAGKSTLGAQAAERLGRRFVDLDRELERSLRQTIPQIFGARGEADFRELEAEAALEALANGGPAVVALGGGAVETEQIRRALREHAFTVHVEIAPATAWLRVGGGDRPLAQDEQSFHELHEQRSPLYDEVAQAVAHDVDGIVLAAAGIAIEQGLLARLPELVDGDVEVVADATVLGLHWPPVEAPVHALRGGEEAKSLGAVERLWRELRLGRDGTIVAFGGGCTTDMAGFAAATYLRGVRWVAVPTTLVGQVDAAIGGKTAINLPEGKNLVGAFHWPERTAIDRALLETLPPVEQRAGMAEVVKTGLLAGEPLWELSEPDVVRRCAAFKATVCLRDPADEGERAMLNLGHTFAHALEAASSYELPHGEAVALGLLAALRLSGLHDEAAQVEELLQPARPAVDADLAWAALERDKKARGGRVRLVLLEAPGQARTGVELPEGDVRRALADLIA